MIFVTFLSFLSLLFACSLVPPGDSGSEQKGKIHITMVESHVLTLLMSSNTFDVYKIYPVSFRVAAFPFQPVQLAIDYCRDQAFVASEVDTGPMGD